MPPAPPATPDADLPEIPDHRRAAAVALALAADGEALRAAFAAAKVPALPRKIAINLSDDAEPAWALFNHAGELVRTAPPGARPRGTTELRLEKLVGLDARFEGASAAGQKRCEALLRRLLDAADTLTRAEFRAAERLMPLLSGRTLEVFDDTVQGVEAYAADYRRIDARKRESGALLAHNWCRIQSLGHLALALAADPEALEAANDDPDLPQPVTEDDPPGVPLMLHRINLDFGFIGPVVRGLRALGALDADLAADAITGSEPPDTYADALIHLPLQAVGALASPSLKDLAVKSLGHAKKVAEHHVREGTPHAALHLRLAEGLLDTLAGTRATAKARRVWLKGVLAEAPFLAERLGAAQPETAAEAEAAAPAPETDEATSAAGADGEEGVAAADAWEDLAMMALLQRPIDWRVQPEAFIDLLTHLLPWAMARRPRDLYPVEALHRDLVAPPPTDWLHEYTLFLQAEMRPAPIVREVPKVGRNEPCPCGSGKKFKKCCGA